ncbi:hypothetical protein Anas_03751 [Armadillidium nasatum]|uniref:Uncharacterized protein n=1 Tax=Armadillidium nasatum TaxID=96803 RepID=A0A5N5SNZ7_9CRUS|nr:hypothetical protein Anas_03751 [Armadillidium nasatum]
MSDSYLGLDQQYDVRLNVIYPLEQLEDINDGSVDLGDSETDSKKWFSPNEAPIFVGKKKEEEKSLEINVESFPELKTSLGPSNKHKEESNQGGKSRKKKKH